MRNKTVTSIAFAAGCILALGAVPPAQAQDFGQPVPTRVETNGPQASHGDFGDWSARRNVAESAQYDRLIESKPGFREARMRKECGPISDPQLHDQCLATFQQYEPNMTGSSNPPRRYHRGAGY